jgi:hypothetical protein
VAFNGYLSDVTTDGRWIYCINRGYSGSSSELFPTYGLARFGLTGRVDPGFQPPRLNWSRDIAGLMVSPDGEIVSSISDTQFGEIIQVRTSLEPVLSLHVSERWEYTVRAGELQAGQTYSLESSPDLTAWIPLERFKAQGVRSVHPLPAEGHLGFFRVRAIP